MTKARVLGIALLVTSLGLMILGLAILVMLLYVPGSANSRLPFVPDLGALGSFGILGGGVGTIAGVALISYKTRNQGRNVLAVSAVVITGVALLIVVINSTFSWYSPGVSPPALSIVSSSLVCSAGTQTCTMNVSNSGASEGTITGAGPGSGMVTFTARQTSIPVSGAGTPVRVTLGGSVTAGQTVSGYLVVSNGPNLYFTAVLGA